MLIIRLYPKFEIKKVWEYVDDKIKEETSGVITPLYASQTEGKMQVGVVIDAKEPDNIIKLLTENIANCQDIHHTTTIALMKPVFFPVPKKKPKTLYRYTVHICTHPKYYKKIYQFLLGYNYQMNFIPIYVAYSLGEEDILMVAMADSQETLNKFLKEKIRTMDGVESAVFYPVVRTKRFASLSKLKKYEKRHMIEKAKDIPDDEIDTSFDWTFENYATLTGAFKRDLR
jgi:hypothetical protein